MREKNPSMEFANKTALAYSAVCKPLCQELGLPQTAFDILLFLANNPTPPAGWHRVFPRYQAR